MPRRMVLCLLLAALTLAVLGRVVGHDFVSLDDRQYILENPRVREGWSARSAAWALTTFHQANWHPLTWLSHQLDAQLFGLGAGGHHATSLVLHVAAAAALLLALEAMTGALWPSCLAAALFAVHPLHVESVAWVSERKDVLSGLLWMLTLAAYLRYARRPGAGRYAAVVGLFALGLAAKPMVVTLPLVLLLLDWWPLGRLPGGRGGSPVPSPAAPAVRAVVLEKVPLLALSAAASAVTLLAQREGGAIFPLLTLPVVIRAGNAALSYARYLGKTLWPSSLSVFYPHPGYSLKWWLAAGAAALLLAATAGVVRLRRGSPWLLVGWLWFLGTLIPVIGLVQAGNQAMADRYTYLPLVGIFVGGAWSLAAAARRRPGLRIAATGGAAAAVLACGALAFAQAGHWRDTVALFTHAVRVTPETNWLAEANLGYEYLRREDPARALGHFAAAVRRQPGIPDFHSAMGMALVRLGRESEAGRAYREALRIDPEFADADFGLAYVLSLEGRNAEAAASYRRVLQRQPENYEASVNLANLLALLGDAAGATALYERAIALRPGDPRPHFNLGAHLVKLGREREAEERFRAALALEPGLSAAENALGNLRYRQGRLAEAAAHYERALRGSPGDPGIRSNLERARARLGAR